MGKITQSQNLKILLLTLSVCAIPLLRATISTAAGLNVSVDNIVDAQCYSSSDGSISVTVTPASELEAALCASCHDIRNPGVADSAPHVGAFIIRLIIFHQQ